jgi:hypothetical protein
LLTFFFAKKKGSRPAGATTRRRTSNDGCTKQSSTSKNQPERQQYAASRRPRTTGPGQRSGRARVWRSTAMGGHGQRREIQPVTNRPRRWVVRLHRWPRAGGRRASHAAHQRLRQTAPGPGTPARRQRHPGALQTLLALPCQHQPPRPADRSNDVQRSPFGRCAGLKTSTHSANPSVKVERPSAAA